ncbi:MAG: phosphoribosylanthranilate isomerase [Ruminococcus sp.]|nr:phosphoribosylanthranilate isomerase [Ruminococcus sp.]
METLIKMCGLRTIDDMRWIWRLIPDYVGFVFAEKSRRYVTPKQAAVLADGLDERITPVGVFVDSSFEEINSIYDMGAIKIAQLHGNEPDELILRLQDAGIKVIRAFQVKSEADIEAAEKSPADLVLLDSGKGSGETFDWSLIKQMSRPYFLAGGLDPKNVKQAIEALHPFAVDVSSGIETNGVKDCNKMMEFAYAVRSK